MPSVNMIAPRRAEMKRLELGMRRLLIAIVVEVFMVLAIAALFSARIFGTKSEVANLDAELAKLRPVVQRIEYYDKASATLQPKVKLLNDAKAHTMRWYHMLQTLSVTVPGETWLTRIAAAPPQKDSNEVLVNLNGISANQNLIGETMLRLNSYPGFERVDLHYTQKATVGKREVIEFEIGAGLEMGEKKRGANKANATNSSY